MKKLLLLGFICFSFSLSAQYEDINSEGFKVFSYQEGETTYTMKQYVICFLIEGPNRDHPTAEADVIQAAHLAHLEDLAKRNKICMVGPMGDDDNIKGVIIFNTPTIEEAKALAKADPAVKAGRLLVEVHPWWGAVGSKLY